MNKFNNVKLLDASEIDGQIERLNKLTKIHQKDYYEARLRLDMSKRYIKSFEDLLTDIKAYQSALEANYLDYKFDGLLL